MIKQNASLFKKNRQQDSVFIYNEPDIEKICKLKNQAFASVCFCM